MRLLDTLVAAADEEEEEEEEEDEEDEDAYVYDEKNATYGEDGLVRFPKKKPAGSKSSPRASFSGFGLKKRPSANGEGGALATGASSGELVPHGAPKTMLSKVTRRIESKVNEIGLRVAEQVENLKRKDED